MKIFGEPRLDGTNMFFSQSIWRTREAFSTVGRIIQLSGSSLRAGLRYIDLLEEEGLVKRERDPQDRRILHLLLSERGRESVEQVLSFALERHAL